MSDLHLDGSDEEVVSLEAILTLVDQMPPPPDAEMQAFDEALDVIERIDANVRQEGVVSRSQMQALVDTCNIALDDRYPLASYTEEPSTEGLEMALEAIGGAIIDGIKKAAKAVIAFFQRIFTWMAGVAEKITRFLFGRFLPKTSGKRAVIEKVYNDVFNQIGQLAPLGRPEEVVKSLDEGVTERIAKAYTPLAALAVKQDPYIGELAYLASRSNSDKYRASKVVKEEVVNGISNLNEDHLDDDLAKLGRVADKIDALDNYYRGRVDKVAKGKDITTTSAFFTAVTEKLNTLPDTGSHEADAVTLLVDRKSLIALLNVSATLNETIRGLYDNVFIRLRGTGPINIYAKDVPGALEELAKVVEKEADNLGEEAERRKLLLFANNVKSLLTHLGMAVTQFQTSLTRKVAEMATLVDHVRNGLGHLVVAYGKLLEGRDIEDRRMFDPIIDKAKEAIDSIGGRRARNPEFHFAEDK